MIAEYIQPTSFFAFSTYFLRPVERKKVPLPTQNGCAAERAHPYFYYGLQMYLSRSIVPSGENSTPSLLRSSR